MPQKRMAPECSEVSNEKLSLVPPTFKRRGIEPDDLSPSDVAVEAALDFRFFNRRTRPHPLDSQYDAHNRNYILDLVSVVQHGDVRNTFYWRDNDNVGMLRSLEMMLLSNYGEQRSRALIQSLEKIRGRGSPRSWAFLWLLCLSVDTGLQDYECSGAVRGYVGTDGRGKVPVDPVALVCYLHGVRTAMREFVRDGMEHCDTVRSAVMNWHVFGGGGLGPR